VSEDGSVMNYNKWVKGIANREFNAQKMMVNDLFNNKNQDQNPNAKQHNNVLPFPLSNLVSTLGNAIVNLQNSLNIMGSLKNNPLVKKESNSVHIEQSIKDITSAAELVYKAAKSVDNIESSI
jgi:hypothetical protein